MYENILLVEDERALQMVLGDRLRKEGYFVDCVSDGEAGFRKATSKAFDLMILDVMLPCRSGLDLCRDIRRAGLRMPILMLTARRSTEDMVAGFSAGADAYVTKPFEMPELSARVEALLRRLPGSRSCVQEDSLFVSTTMRGPETPEPGTASKHDRDRHQDADQERKPQNKLDELLAEGANSQKLDEVIPRLRTMLEDEKQSTQTHCDAAFLSVAEDLIEFLEDILAGVRSLRRHSSNDI